MCLFCLAVSSREWFSFSSGVGMFGRRMAVVESVTKWTTIGCEVFFLFFAHVVGHAFGFLWGRISSFVSTHFAANSSLACHFSCLFGFSAGAVWVEWEELAERFFPLRVLGDCFRVLEVGEFCRVGFWWRFRWFS